MTVAPKKGPATTIAYASIGVDDVRPAFARAPDRPTYGKRIQHFLTVQFKYPDGRGDFVELEMGKDVARRLVAQLEARSSKTMTRSGGG
jgi:hypothetical protein